jgi:membrane protease YdiL (CAAX protease family)
MKHIMAIFMVVIVPLISYFTIRRIRMRLPKPRQKEKIYLAIYAINWIYLFILIQFVTTFKELYLVKYPLHLPWWISAAAVIALVWGAASTVMPQLFFRRSEEVRKTILSAYKDEAHIFPETCLQRRMMAFVAITVGISEEIIYRGFITNYLHEEWSMPVLLSIVVSAILFGLGHFHQGGGETVSSTVFGLLMSYLYLATGSLLLPILVHILYDMKIVTMTWIIQKYGEEIAAG